MAGRFWGALLAGLVSSAGAAEPAAPVDSWPAISIIIDDLGRDLPAGLRAVRLPGAVACAFLPRSLHARRLALAAHSHNKEVLLHLPMQPVGLRPLDAGGLTLDMTERELVQALEQDLASVPHVSGVNNHMGSLLTRHPGHMLWLMQALNRHGDLFFVDSRTTSATVALQVAAENQVPGLERDVFLDNRRDPEAISTRFDELLAKARARGFAVGIGHPRPATLEMLEQLLPTLEQERMRLVPIAEMLKLRQRRVESWRASWSPSPKGVKSSRPSP
ncbi:MAG: divergent polysaccharide deacetylase family protein [Gammaproteobacteria bacterium]|nr:divergent polysaccharide deacetylase family protein [Gammaproteobacteria bacterium]NIR98670.1 divergent polysaccharide deacetylase family protein [Gammaproteobacteria bacterium]NIT64382.1 divergent polysaccharide deacetylase family protein [Gammaproteobacteria bacterium]NIV19481.1 divergent polysaccharide deacetylase family protein [Gammaproteobacteria bacterium]NIY32962.1 divergent polysaccharide deacetylase family protein [Gammaproteobacteria bacterium]